jgi:ADP-ribosylglycohydrolase
MNSALLQRFKGSLVGVHVGDSIGAPYEETFKPAQIAADITARGGLKFFDYPNPWAALKDGNEGILPAGRPTDDTEQTARLARSLLACNGLDQAHLHDELRASTFGKESVLWNGRSTGGGKTTFNALSNVPARIEQARTNPFGTNGSLMRSAPLGLWWATQIMSSNNEIRLPAVKAAKAMTYAMSDVTHAHPHSKQACWIYTMILSSLLAGNEVVVALGDIDDMDPSVKKDPMTIRIGSRLNDQHDLPYDPGAFPMRGTAEFSLYVALYALQHATSFADGIEIAVRVGGDTDTYAAIAGGLLGAHYGYEAIPLEWRNTILGHDQMVDYATKIYQLRVKPQ